MRLRIIFIAIGLVAVGCSSAPAAEQQVLDASISPAPAPSTTAVAPSTTSTTAPTTLTTSTTAPTTTTTTTIPRPSGQARPDWLGTLDLELRDGEDHAISQPTPPELIDRQLWTEDVLAPPPGSEFVSSIESPPPPDVVFRSTWKSECPVGLDELAYAQVSYFGFDGLYHTGEFILHTDFAADVVDIFAELHDRQFPIEQMVVTSQAALDAAPTGDGNNTSSFVCRQAVNSGNWSRHAFGGAIDINPFHNPYVKDDLVIPALASAYADRERVLPGMVDQDIASLFAEIGWGWGGNWRTVSDPMHFSDTGN